jgi:hypothetical protein
MNRPAEMKTRGWWGHRFRENSMGRRFSQMNTDNHFLSPILIIRIHPAQKAISYTIKLQMKTPGTLEGEGFGGLLQNQGPLYPGN